MSTETTNVVETTEVVTAPETPVLTVENTVVNDKSDKKTNPKSNKKTDSKSNKKTPPKKSESNKKADSKSNKKSENKTPSPEDSKKKPGRPRKYDYDMILKCLKKFAGKVGGLKAAHDEIVQVSGHEKIAYMSVSKIAHDHEISFGLGKPKEKQEEKPVSKKSNKKTPVVSKKAA